MLPLLLTGLLATSVALASDDSSGATKTVLSSVPSLIRYPIFQSSRFVVTSGQRPSEQASPVRAVSASSSEANVVLHQQEVPQQEQPAAGLSQQTYSSYPQYSDYSHRRYVPSYVYSPPPYVYPSFSGAVHHPFLPVQQSPVIELDALSAPTQILVRTPTGVQVFRPTPHSRPPVHYFVGVFPTVSEQHTQQSSNQPAAQEQTLVTKVEVPVSSEVTNETQSSGTSPAVVSLASSGSVTEVVPSSGFSTGETKTESSITPDSF